MSMKKSVLKKEHYEVPSIECLLAEVEMGFVGSPDGSAGNGGFGELGDEFDSWGDTPSTGGGMGSEDL